MINRSQSFLVDLLKFFLVSEEVAATATFHFRPHLSIPNVRRLYPSCNRLHQSAQHGLHLERQQTIKMAVTRKGLLRTTTARDKMSCHRQQLLQRTLRRSLLDQLLQLPPPG